MSELNYFNSAKPVWPVGKDKTKILRNILNGRVNAKVDKLNLN